MVRQITTPFHLCSLLLSVLAANCSPFAIGQSSMPLDTPAIVHATGPSLVTIVLRDATGRELGTGSGFVVTSDGRVITNAHVIQMKGATQADARFQDGSSFQVLGVAAVDSERDLAIIKLRSANHVFATAHLGNSDSVEVGQHVIAIGSPLADSGVNTDSTVSDGIVSGIRDWPNGRMKVFQVSAPLSPGSSGGALLSMSGDVIGVTFAQLREGQNLNFAIPITYATLLMAAPDGPLRSLTESSPTNTPEARSAVPEGSPNGSYTGVWQSAKFQASGAASLRITVSLVDGFTDATIFLTGGEVTSATLSGTAHKTGENIWTVELNSKKPKLHVRGIFRGNSFVGDYTYTRLLLFDQGQWLLRKE